MEVLHCFQGIKHHDNKDAYPLAKIDDCIDSLARKELFCMLDMNSSYWQIPIVPEDQHKTAFITRYGLYQFLHMTFGTSSAPATFQRYIIIVLAELIWDIAIVYLDDVNVTGQSFWWHVAESKDSAQQIQGIWTKNLNQASASREVHCLGSIADKHNVQMMKEHIQDVLDWLVPANQKELERFLGFIIYHRNYLQALAGKQLLFPCFRVHARNGPRQSNTQRPSVICIKPWLRLQCWHIPMQLTCY